MEVNTSKIEPKIDEEDDDYSAQVLVLSTTIENTTILEKWVSNLCTSAKIAHVFGTSIGLLDKWSNNRDSVEVIFVGIGEIDLDLSGPDSLLNVELIRKQFCSSLIIITPMYKKPPTIESPWEFDYIKNGADLIVFLENDLLVNSYLESRMIHWKAWYSNPTAILLIDNDLLNSNDKPEPMGRIIDLILAALQQHFSCVYKAFGSNDLAFVNGFLLSSSCKLLYLHLSHDKSECVRNYTSLIKDIESETKTRSLQMPEYESVLIQLNSMGDSFQQQDDFFFSQIFDEMVKLTPSGENIVKEIKNLCGNMRYKRWLKEKALISDNTSPSKELGRLSWRRRLSMNSSKILAFKRGNFKQKKKFRQAPEVKTHRELVEKFRIRRSSLNIHRKQPSRYEHPTYMPSVETCISRRDILNHPEWSQGNLKGSKKVLHPESEFRFKWDIFIIFIVIFNFVMIPYHTAFITTPPLAMVILDKVIDFMFVIDIYLNFNTAYFDQYGNLVSNLKQIRKKYFNTWFMIDLIAIIPFEDLYAIFAHSDISNQGTGLTIVLKCPRLFRLRRIIRRIQDIRQASAFRVFQLYLTILLVDHWVACGWYLVCVTQENLSWIKKAGIKDETPFGKYLGCLYSTTLMLFLSTDIPAETSGQRGYSIFIMMIGAAAYGSIFGSVASIIASLDSASSIRKLKHGELSNQMASLQLPRNLKQRVYNYFDSTWNAEKSMAFSSDSFFKDLSPCLRKEVSLYMYGDIILTIPCFKHLPPQVIEHIVMEFKPVFYLKGDYIIREGDISNSAGILSSGTIEINKENSKEVVKITTGAFFGVDSLIKENPRSQESLVAVSYCKILQFSKDSFKTIKLNFPEEGETLNDDLIKYAAKRTKY